MWNPLGVVGVIISFNFPYAILGYQQDLELMLLSKLSSKKQPPGYIFGSARCDYGNQLAFAMQQIEEAGRGILVY
ncbi:hypothetical protein L2E82_17477 [Cichorium intybus]|uniref:Uncharacterized protein n=1 Tax=Cichorium intybus TaxID=13427 RepID=A0ACB9F8W3_CICIN|nr:hypothetical protein L2E82_17477 [Cichorium intybus]